MIYCIHVFINLWPAYSTVVFPTDVDLENRDFIKKNHVE